MPEEAYLYALPYSLYKEHGVRRYGAHGTSHYFVSREVAEYVGKPADQVNAIICHLGNGGSVSVVVMVMYRYLYGFNPVRRFSNGYTLW